MNGESKGARVASGDLKMRCILKRLTEPTGESSALWHTTLLAKSIPNKTVRMGGAGNGSRKDQGLHMKVDTTAIEQEIAAYEKQLRQHYSTKSRLMEEIDSLDPDDRLYKMYDKIEEVENGLMDARAKKQTIEADKITGDNIYKILIWFDKFYATMTEAERRRLVEILIDEVQICPERQPNGQWLKSVWFKLPIIDHDLELSLDNQDRVEVADALIPQRQQLLCSILAAAAAAAVDQQRRLLIGQRLGHFAPDALVGHKDGVFNMPAIVFLPGADIHHHDLLRDHHLIGFLGADLMIRRFAGHILRVLFCFGQRAAAQQRKRGGKCRKK